MYEHRYRFFPLSVFSSMANGGSWNTKRIGAGLLYSPMLCDVSLVRSKRVQCQGSGPAWTGVKR